MTVLRNIVLLQLRPEATEADVDAIEEALRGLDVAGRLSVDVHRDAGLRPGNMSVAVITDFEDEGAYLSYDADPGHVKIRDEQVAPVTAALSRIQFRVESS